MPACRPAEGQKLFNDSRWKQLRAPVVPPEWVVELVRETNGPIFWENSRTVIGTRPEGYFPMLYCSEMHGNEIITHLCPGSCIPIDGWLQDLA
jgi:hypothetical protein